MKIKTKLGLLVFLLSLLMIVSSLVAIYGFNEVKTRYQGIVAINDPLIVNLREIQYFFTGQANDERGYLLTGSDEYKREILQKSSEVKKRLQMMRTLISTDEEREMVSRIDAAHTRYTDINMAVIALYTSGETEGARRLSFGEGREVRKNLETTFNEFVEHNDVAAKATKAGAEEQAGRLVVIILAAVVAAVVVGSVSGLFLARGITQPLAVLNTEITRLAKNGGDLTQQINVASHDEVGDLAKAINVFLADVRRMMRDIGGATVEIKKSSDVLVDIASTVAANSQEMSATVGMVSAAVEEISAGTEENASSTEQVSHSVESVAKMANDMSVAAKEAV
ncbi:MAG: methyl-accepting chemotaxis protein, partial [Negativicutes bacterium]|nr:methyl-accepting chemotaxis protein [Negativicutes bacterium]